MKFEGIVYDIWHIRDWIKGNSRGVDNRFEYSATIYPDGFLEFRDFYRDLESLAGAIKSDINSQDKREPYFIRFEVPAKIREDFKQIKLRNSLLRGSLRRLNSDERRELMRYFI